MLSNRVALFGDLLRRYRQAAGLTQEELAELAGLSPKGISDLERGARTNPRRETVAMLARALALSDRDRATLEAAARQRPQPGAGQVAGGATTAATVGKGHGPGIAERGPLVGRAREVALLQQQLDGTGPPLFVVTGEPGIGKSRVLQEVASRGEEQGWRTLAGGCHRRSGQEPYAPFLGVLERAVLPLPPAQMRAALHGCNWLVRLLPELAEVLPQPVTLGTLTPEQERRMVFAAVVRYLANVSGPAGTLLVLDDLHWAGQDALDLLGALVRAPAPERPLRVVVAYRDTEVRARDPLAVLLADLAREGLVARTQLDPLPGTDAAALLDGLLPASGGAPAPLRRRVLERAGGIPFYIVNWAQGLRTGALTGDDRGDVPWSVSETLRQRVSALPPLAQELLGAAAVIGRTAPMALLLHVATGMGHGEAETLAAFDAACQARILMEEGPDAYAFAHDLIREVVTADLGVARRALLHRTVAEALEREPGEPPLAALAYHFARAGMPEREVDYLERAADHAKAVFANAQAADQYAELVGRLELLGHAGEAARAREKLALVLTVLARYDDVLETLDRADAVYREQGDLEGRRRALAQVGWILAHRGRAEDGLARVLPVVKASSAAPDADSSPPKGLASLHATLAYLYYMAGRYDEQRAAAERAVALARAEGDELALVLAQDRLALALLMLGRIDDGVRLLTDEVIPLAETKADYARTLGRTLHNVSWACSIRGEFALERRYLDRAIASAERVGDPAELSFMIFKRGRNAFLRGDWAAARADFERAREQVRALTANRYTLDPLHGLGRLALAEGKREEGERALAEAREMADRIGDVETGRIAAGALAEQDLLEGRAAEALAGLRPVIPFPSTQPAVLERLPILAWAYLETGDFDRADEILEHTIAAARAARLRPALAAALQMRAGLAQRQRRWDAAARDIDESLALARHAPSLRRGARPLSGGAPARGPRRRRRGPRAVPCRAGHPRAARGASVGTLHRAPSGGAGRAGRAGRVVRDAR